MNLQKINWSEFQTLDSVYFTPTDFAETLDGGQAFGWYRDDENENAYTGLFDSNLFKLRLNDSGNVEFAHASKKHKIIIASLKKYLDIERDYDILRKKLFKIRDTHLNKELHSRPTLRILNQPINETIIAFICSSSKRIVQIKQCLWLLRKNLGSHIAGDFYSLPTFEKIANAPLEKILDCKLGFRAKYLQQSAQKILNDSFDLNNLSSMPYLEAKKYLTGLSGIGDKIADCILLFGAQRFEAFPVDTWIIKSCEKLYGISNPNQIRTFAKNHFGEYAGYAQQLLFASS